MLPVHDAQSGSSKTRKRKRRAIAVSGSALFTLAYIAFRQQPTTDWLDIHATFNSSTQATAWASISTDIQQSFFPDPFAEFRLTILHSHVRTVNETYRNPAILPPESQTDEYVHILSFIEETPLRNRGFPEWQAYVAPDLSFIDSIDCRFVIGKTQATSKAVQPRTKAPHYPVEPTQNVHLIFCPVPFVVKEAMYVSANRYPTRLYDQKPASSMTLQLDFKLADESPFRQTIKLNKLGGSDTRERKQETAICLAPIHHWSQESAEASIEWREHHRRLGVETVHWYGREKGLEDHVKVLDKLLGVKDTFRFAPHLSPETYGNDILMEKGEYADQILYYMDCHLRSMTSQPTEWLSFTDLDEFYIPEPFAPTGLAQFLSRQEDNVGSVCIGRTHTSLNDSSRTTDLRLGNYSHIREPSYSEGPDNGKCLYRTSAFELLGVHEPVSFFPGYWDKHLREESSLRIVHFGNFKPLGTGPWTKPFDATAAYRSYVEQLEPAVASLQVQLKSETQQSWFIQKAGSKRSHRRPKKQ